MPFDALKGFKEAIKEKERIVVEKKEMTEDLYEELNLEFKKIKKGSIVKVIYYSKDEYIEYTGMVSEVNESARYIKVVKEKISLDDILSKKVFRKLVGGNSLYLKRKSGELLDKLDELFGKNRMVLCREVILRLVR